MKKENRQALRWSIMVSCLLLGPSLLGANEMLSLTSPLDYQVVQRQKPSGTPLRVQGKTTFMAGKWQYRLLGTPLSGQADETWHEFPSPVADGAFDFTFNAPAGGWYRLELRGLGAAQTSVEANVPHVGIGEVFIVAGQSNAGNYGSERQSTRSGNVSSFDGVRWTLANDPLRGADGQGGSFMPVFGDALNQRFHVPIGIVPVAAGGTSVRQWLPQGERVRQQPTTGGMKPVGPGGWESTGDLFNRLAWRFSLLGPRGFRALLWHQGESDAGQARAGYPADRQITGEHYVQFMGKLIRASREKAGWSIPWFTAQTTYHNEKDPSDQEFRAAMKELWVQGLSLQGPDTDTLGSEFRFGIHFNGKGLRKHGEMWAEKVAPWLDTQFADAPSAPASPTGTPRSGAGLPVKETSRPGHNPIPGKPSGSIAQSSPGASRPRRPTTRAHWFTEGAFMCCRTVGM